MGLYISNQWSSQLMEVTNDLLIIGLERSAKFSHRSLNSDRFIIGPQHKSLTADHLNFILAGLNFPKQFVPDALNWFSKSNQIGLGFEQNNGVSSYRLYFEFFDRYKPDPLLNSGVLHLGYKWHCDDPSKIKVTHYVFAPHFDGRNPEQVVRKTLFTVNESFTGDVVSATVKTFADVPAENRIMTCAAEDCGCRRSFDVNVYKSKKNLSFLKTELENISQFFRIEKTVLEKFLSESGNAVLGHISCGLDTNNNPFFTVYFDDFTTYLTQRKK